MNNIEEKTEVSTSKTDSLNIPFYKEETKEIAKVEEPQSTTTLVEKIHEQAKYDVVKNDKDVQNAILETAKKNVAIEMDTLSNKTAKDNNKASMERNAEACSIFGFSSKENIVERWQQKMMVWGYNFWFCIYYVFAFFTVAPITMLFGKIQIAIKKTWLSILFSIFIYGLIAIGLPIIIANIHK